MKTVFKDIQSALIASKYDYFVISDNEVHAFQNLEQAEADQLRAKYFGIETELINRKGASNKYLITL